jgi:anti-sigma regulatory factor (Ser/Thr protein kinase)
MRLEPDQSAPTNARRYARLWASNEGLPKMVVDDVALVVTELVTNAVLHGEPPIEVDLTNRSGRVRGNVSDGSTVLPRQIPAPDERGGFGLRIVESRTANWGVTPHEGGKSIWFEID